MRIEQADRDSELWQRLRANVGPTGDIDPDEHVDAIWLALTAFRKAKEETTAPAGSPLKKRQPGREEDSIHGR
jgi:hypothetical protein